MKANPLAAAALLAAGALLGWLAGSGRVTTEARAQDKTPAPAEKADGPPADPKPEPPEAAEVRKANAAFAEAFGRGDARAVAALWTEGGEYLGPDGETLRGRPAIEKAYAEFFKNNPRARLDARVESIRL